MTKKRGMLPGTNRKQNWGILAPGPVDKPFHKPDHLNSLLQAQYQNTKIPGDKKASHTIQDDSK